MIVLLVCRIEENKVISIILSNHEQIIKKSPPVLKFLASQKKLKPGLLPLIISLSLLF